MSNSDEAEHIVNKKAPTGNHSVGYGRPPKEHQFKKGQSGNPSGRPRGSTTYRDAFDEAFRCQTTIRIGGSERKVPMSKALAYSVVSNAIKGNPAAQKMALSALAEISEQTQNAGASMSEGDMEILADLQRRLREELQCEISTPEAQQ